MMRFLVHFPPTVFARIFYSLTEEGQTKRNGENKSWKNSESEENAFCTKFVIKRLFHCTTLSSSQSALLEEQILCFYKLGWERRANSCSRATNDPRKRAKNPRPKNRVEQQLWRIQRLSQKVMFPRLPGHLPLRQLHQRHRFRLERGKSPPREPS